MAKSVTLNNEQRLYVIPCGNGYTCLGFDYCENRSNALSSWIVKRGGVVPNKSEKGTIEAYNTWLELCRIGKTICNVKGIRCDIELVKELIGKEGKRIEVVDCHGETRRFTVGKSTGWMPCHLELNTISGVGGPAVMGTPFRSIRFL